MACFLRQKCRAVTNLTPLYRYSFGPWYKSGHSQPRFFSNTPKLLAIKPYLLADIGEGITECQIVSWLVKPGDEVQEFDPICEVQSDKASVEITSRFEGRIDKLHYEPGDMAVVGSPLLDIDVNGAEGEISTSSFNPDVQSETESAENETSHSLEAQPWLDQTPSPPWTSKRSEVAKDATNPILLSPAVRRMLKEHSIDAAEVQGTGKDQRILKGDVQRLIEARVGSYTSGPYQQQSSTSDLTGLKPPPPDQQLSLSPVQLQMFKSMTQSLSIPHFLYTHTVDVTALTSLRQRVTSDRLMASQLRNEDRTPVKLTLLPFILKALSIAVASFPIINSTLVTMEGGNQPQLTLKGAHNFGIAVDTPRGLLVPVVRNVQDHSVISLAKEIYRLGYLAREGKLKPEDMQGATLVVSNIGSIGGQVVAPVILSPMTAIVAVGKIDQVPAFAIGDDGKEMIVKKMQTVLSWSADHRVLDGATVARCAQQVALLLENIDYMGLNLKHI